MGRCIANIVQVPEAARRQRARSSIEGLERARAVRVLPSEAGYRAEVALLTASSFKLVPKPDDTNEEIEGAMSRVGLEDVRAST